MNRHRFICRQMAVVTLWLLMANLSVANGLSLHDIIQLAVDNDPSLRANQQRQQGLNETAVASSTRPDPRLSVSMMNLPTDGFALNQEPMTQFFVGIAQTLPRGDSLDIKRKQLETSAEQLEHMRQDRRLKLKQTISEYWLNAKYAKLSLEQLINAQPVLEAFLQVRSSGYTSTSGASQSDLLQAQLRLLELRDRQTQLTQQYDTAVTGLYEWLPTGFGEIELTFSDDQSIPAIAYSKISASDGNALTSLIQTHPAILAVQDKIRQSQQGIALAQQSYSPEWQLSAGYALRADTPQGQSRADFFTLGVSVDLPLFTHNRQDRQVNAAVYEAEAVKSDLHQLAKQMTTAIQTTVSRLTHVDSRIALYESALLPLTQQQVASLTLSYANDTGQVIKTLDAQINQIEKRIALLSLQREQQVLFAHLHYLLAGHLVSPKEQAKG